MKKILVFGGTAEGRNVCAYLTEKKVMHTVCVATQYGEEVLPKNDFMEVRQGRLDTQEMEALIRAGGYAAVIDATHPYAAVVSENVRAACKNTGVEYLRYLRASGCEQDAMPQCSDKNTQECIYVDSASEAADYLESQTGNIFLTTGSKELHVFTERLSDIGRLFARVLPSAEVVASCRALGLEGKQICAMQGPFSQAVNEAMLLQTEAAFLVTKDTGNTGGFPEKEEAARRTGVRMVIIRRPSDAGMDWETLKARLDEFAGLSQGEECAADENRANEERIESKKDVHSEYTEGMNRVHEAYTEGMSIQTEHASDSAAVCSTGGSQSEGGIISCIGIGMGNADGMTVEAEHALQQSDIVFGASRMLETARKTGLQPPVMIEEYRAGEIRAYLDAHPQYRRAAVLFSGDIGFFSGADAVRGAFADWEVQYFCGISSVVYFASRIPTAWQDAKLISAHGRAANVSGYVRRCPKIIALSGTAKEVRKICEELIEYGLGHVSVTAGVNLSYEDEQIITGTPEQLLGIDTKGLHILLIQNDRTERTVTPGLPDEAFIRGKVPMTKEEIRTLSVAKLRLAADSIVYDVGAGTGSVAIECARICTDGCVCAVEKNPEGIRLIRENSRKLGTANVEVIEGLAPQALEELPVPTHAFIGGSSGNMKQIVELLLQKNKDIRIVINTIALESIAEALAVIRELGIADADIVQMQASKAKVLGRYHMMEARNPVYIVSFGGGKEE